MNRLLYGNNFYIIIYIIEKKRKKRKIEQTEKVYAHYIFRVKYLWSVREWNIFSFFVCLNDRTKKEQDTLDGFLLAVWPQKFPLYSRSMCQATRCIIYAVSGNGVVCIGATEGAY